MFVNFQLLLVSQILSNLRFCHLNQTKKIMIVRGSRPAISAIENTHTTLSFLGKIWATSTTLQHGQAAASLGISNLGQEPVF